MENYDNLPIVFGNEYDFYILYKKLLNINFPLDNIKAYYLFESGRWDLEMFDNKVIKLPISDYQFSIKNFIESINNDNFNKYKIFDYRIKNQLILN